MHDTDLLLLPRSMHASYLAIDVWVPPDPGCQQKRQSQTGSGVDTTAVHAEVAHISVPASLSCWDPVIPRPWPMASNTAMPDMDG